MKTRPYHEYRELPPPAMQQAAQDYCENLSRRRSVRVFDPRPVPAGVVENCLRAAGTAPSGANHQPWHFVVVSNPQLKSQLRAAAEEEERAFYHGRAPQEWLQALAPLGTDEHKPFLEQAPLLIAIFAKSWQQDGGKNYYVQESVGIATGMLITGLHLSGLCCLTHTPSPMGFMRQILGRPENERPFLLLVVGYPAAAVEVPDITRLPLEEYSTFLT